jgi:hypothetical protein
LDLRNKTNEHKIFVVKSEENRTFKTLRSKWEDNIKMDLREILCDCVDWL